MSVEPSMEDILSSIKRIIAEEGEASVASRSRRATRMSTPRERSVDPSEVLELSHPVAAEPTLPANDRVDDVEVEADAILSDSAAEASRDALDSLSKILVKPEPKTSQTLDDLVREMLRPMLRDWLDAKLPGMVETMVAREIARITQGR